MTDESDEPLAKMSEDDAVSMFQLPHWTVAAKSQNANANWYAEHGMKNIDAAFSYHDNYDSTFHDVNVMYENQDLKMTWRNAFYNHKQTAPYSETEKYPHVTFFFSGERKKHLREKKNSDSLS